MIPVWPRFLRLPVVIMLLLACLYSLRTLIPLNRGFAQLQSTEREALYLPSMRGIRAATFGFQNVAAHLLWFKTIDYFGKHYVTDKNYTWLAHMCSLVTSLSPRSSHVYGFCSTMLAWEAHQPKQAIEILDAASGALPNDWRFPYLRGMTRLLFLSDARTAHADFIESALKPNAHSIVKRLAAKALAQENNPHTAVEFLDEMISQEQDPNARKALVDRRLEILRETQK
jgi:hypothetical protein